MSSTPKPRAVLGLLHVSPVVIRGGPCCLNFPAEDNQESFRACLGPLGGNLCPVLLIPALLPTPRHCWAGLGQASGETEEASFSTDLAMTRRRRAKGTMENARMDCAHSQPKGWGGWGRNEEAG